MPNAEQRANKGVSPGLDDDPVAGIDQDHGKIAGRGAGRHVAGVLLVTRRIGNDKGARRGREKAVRDIDRYALLPLVLQPVEQQRKIEIASRSCRSVLNSRSSVSS